MVSVQVFLLLNLIVDLATWISSKFCLRKYLMEIGVVFCREALCNQFHWVQCSAKTDNSYFSAIQGYSVKLCATSHVIRAEEFRFLAWNCSKFVLIFSIWFEYQSCQGLCVQYESNLFGPSHKRMASVLILTTFTTSE